MPDLVRIQVDLTAGSASVEAPTDALDAAFERLEAFLPTLAAARSVAAAETLDPSPASNGARPSIEVEGAVVAEATKSQKRRASSKTGTYNTIDLGLDEPQRESFRQFFSSKVPKGQSQQVLTVMAWLKQNGGRPIVSYDDIFTSLRIVNARIPKSLSGVLTNLKTAAHVVGDNSQFAVTAPGEDFVKFDMPAQKKT